MYLILNIIMIEVWLQYNQCYYNWLKYNEFSIKDLNITRFDTNHFGSAFSIGKNWQLDFCFGTRGVFIWIIIPCILNVESSWNYMNVKLWMPSKGTSSSYQHLSLYHQLGKRIKYVQRKLLLFVDHSSGI